MTRRVFGMFLEMSHADQQIAGPFGVKLLRSSPFHTRSVMDIALMLTTPLTGVSNAAGRESIKTLLQYVLSSWGQTKVVEDVFKTARQREHRDTLNALRAVPAYYAAMVAMETVALHDRKEI